MRQLDDYLRYLQDVRNASPHTVAAYRSDLHHFLDSLDPKQRSDPAGIGGNELKHHLLSLVQDGRSRATVARRAASLRGFFRYLLQRELIREDPSASLRVPKKPRVIPRVLSTEQIERLLAAPVGEGFVAVRDRALLEILYSAGLRVSELVGSNLLDLDRADATLRVMGKGSRERLGLLGRHALKALDDYLPLRTHRTRITQDEALIVNRFGTRLSARSVRRSLERYIVAAELPSGVTPHTLRHSFATHLLEQGAGIKEVQELLGHRHLSSTQIYTHISPQHLRKVYDAAHPRGGASQSFRSNSS